MSETVNVNCWDSPPALPSAGAAHRTREVMRQCVAKGAALEAPIPPKVRQFRDPARRKVELAACLAECAGLLPNQRDDGQI